MNLTFSLYLLPIFIAIYLWFKLKIPIKKAIALVLLPPFLFTLPFVISNGLKGFLVFLFGIAFTFVALLYYALIVLYLLKRYKLGYFKLFLVGGVVGYIVGFINFAILQEGKNSISSYASAAIIPMITGAISIVLVEFISKKIK